MGTNFHGKHDKSGVGENIIGNFVGKPE